MLVLTRKPGQSILIGDGIEVQILSSAKEKVRVGITAPHDISIFRNEVKERIERASERERASSAPEARLRPSARRAPRT